MRVNILFPALLVVSILAATPAHASMKFCNRTQQPLQAAFGYRDTVWISEGWWRLEAGQCLQVSDKPLTQRFFFYYGISLAPHPDTRPPVTWNGKYQLCVDIKAFHIEGDGECESRGYHTQGFQEIDIGSTARDYTLDFKD